MCAKKADDGMLVALPTSPRMQRPPCGNAAQFAEKLRFSVVLLKKEPARTVQMPESFGNAAYILREKECLFNAFRVTVEI